MLAHSLQCYNIAQTYACEQSWAIVRFRFPQTCQVLSVNLHIIARMVPGGWSRSVGKHTRRVNHNTLDMLDRAILAAYRGPTCNWPATTGRLRWPHTDGRLLLAAY